MGKGSNLYFQQQQARQLREMEKHQAAMSGQPLRKLSWMERNVLGLKDEPAPRRDESHGGSERAMSQDKAEPTRPDQEHEKDTPTEAGDPEVVPSAGGPREGAPRVAAQGYKIDVTWDGQTLTVTAGNKLARAALLGERHGDGPLTLVAEEIESTELKSAGALTNGRLTIRTTDRKTYRLHFHSKSNAEFGRLYKALPG